MQTRAAPAAAQAPFAEAAEGAPAAACPLPVSHVIAATMYPDVLSDQLIAHCHHTQGAFPRSTTLAARRVS